MLYNGLQQTKTTPLPINASSSNNSRNIGLIQNYSVDKSTQPAEFNRLLLEDLEGGVSRIALNINEQSASDVGIESILQELRTSAGSSGPSTGPYLAGVHCNLVTIEVPAAALRSHLHSKPKKSVAELPTTSTILGYSDFERMTEFIPVLRGFAWTLNIAEFHNFGADAVTELACMLSVVGELARHPQGNEILSNPRGISIRLGINSAHLTCIAKLRAARILWAKLMTQDQMKIKMQNSALRLHAETTRTELSHIDTWTNIIRHSAAAAAAIMANCDEILIHPHDQRIARQNSFGNRIARNILNTLVYESKLNAFYDPLAGAFAIESMTTELADRAWQLHQDIENSGGLSSVLANETGIIARLIRAQRALLITEESHRRPGMLGVSEYANPAEANDLANHENPEAFIIYSAKAQLADNWDYELVLSDIFGTLRDAANAASIEYLPILLDDQSSVSARLAWTENALNSAGLSPCQNKTASAKVVRVLIGKDTTYSDILLTTLSEQVQLGKNDNQSYCFVVAGRLPPELEKSAKAVGLNATLYSGCNLEKTLREILLKAGAAL